MCARDVVAWCNRWAWTYDPRELNPTLPFDLFPKQAAFLCWLAGRERLQQDGLVEKSRDMGITWLCCAYALHAWLFSDRSLFSLLPEAWGEGLRALITPARALTPDPSTR